jgi:putative FmdB family regulatory protein
MPTYEYECLTCGTHFEKRQSFHDAPQADCPQGHPETRRVVAVAPLVVFKGKGFYVTDNPGKNGSNGAGKKAETTTETKAETKTETKAENKTETKIESSKQTA